MFVDILKHIMMKPIEYSEVSNLLIDIDNGVLKRIQNELLDMYLDLLEVCQKHELTPFLVGGSALGAVRHQGFIPWDEDMDLAMTRKDYIKLKSVFESELGDKYILSAPNSDVIPRARYPKMLKKSVHLRELNDVDDESLHKLFIDIFLIDNVPDEKGSRWLKASLSRVIGHISSVVFSWQYRDANDLINDKTNATQRLRFIVGKIFSFWSFSRWASLLDKIVTYESEGTQYVTLSTGALGYEQEMIKREWVFPASYLEFEGSTVPVFHDVKAYLEKRYGDYQRIPDVNERGHHFIRELSFDK